MFKVKENNDSLLECTQFFFFKFLKKINLLDCEAILTRVFYKLVSYKKCVVITLIITVYEDITEEGAFLVKLQEQGLQHH